MIDQNVVDTTNRPKLGQNELTAEQLRNLVVKGMLEKKGMDVVVMDLRNVANAITDFFIICSGTSDTQIDAIASSVEEEVYKVSKTNPWHREGQQNREWILLDYVDIVAHVFKKERRAFYDLEQLWGDADIQHIESEEDLVPQQA